MNEKFQLHGSASIVPPPFAWIDIPAGGVTLTDRGGYLAQATTFSVAAFAIGKYPITNAQYQCFADAPDGYPNAAWWDFSEAGAASRGENPMPKQVEYGDGDHPRTHVTWYEAVAFCRWLSQAAGENARLPTEAEWQRAAQGDDAREYPWGGQWDSSRCHNNMAKASIGPTSVLEYAGKGDSPFGAVDMSGNVWEWCLTNWDTGKNDLEGEDVRVLRGGSWFDDVRRSFRAETRSSWNPDIRSDLRGFRIVRAASLSI